MTCEEIKKEIESFKKDLIKQINDSDLDMQEMLKGIIKVSSKYPEQKELIEFIVILNDTLTRDSKNIRNNIIEMIDACFGYKIKILEKIDAVNKKTNNPSTFRTKMRTAVLSVRNLILSKLVIPLVIVVIIFVLYILFPDSTEHFFKDIFPQLSKIF